MKECLMHTNALREDLEHLSVWLTAWFLNTVLPGHSCTHVLAPGLRLLSHYRSGVE